MDQTDDLQICTATPLAEWNSMPRSAPGCRCVHELFEEQARLRPDALALISGSSQLTYGELNSRANALARHLVSLGVARETLVGLCVERSVEMIAAVLGLSRAQ